MAAPTRAARETPPQPILRGDAAFVREAEAAEDVDDADVLGAVVGAGVEDLVAGALVGCGPRGALDCPAI